MAAAAAVRRRQAGARARRAARLGVCLLLLACSLGAAAKKAPAVPQPAAPAEQPQGVICTMTRNESRYLREWIQFHLLSGATKIVIYDDKSEDGLAEVVAPFGDAVVVHDLYTLEGVPPAFLEPGRRPFINRKIWAFNHCGRKHGAAGRGWMAILDVDEYIYPCTRNVNDTLWDAFAPRVADNITAGIRLQCVKFGFNDFNRPLQPGQLMIQHHTHRAPYPELEPHIEAWARANLTGCRKNWCINNGAHKIMYRLDTAAGAKPGIHSPASVKVARRISTAWSRSDGVCCNHYMLRSEQELVEKYSKTGLKLAYAPMARPDPRRWFTTVHDTQIWQFLPDMKQALAARGYPVSGVNVAPAQPLPVPARAR